MTRITIQYLTKAWNKWQSLTWIKSMLATCTSKEWWWWWWFSAGRHVHWLFHLPGMRWVRWYPIAFLTDNCGWETCPRSLCSGLGKIRTCDTPVARHRTYCYTTAFHISKKIIKFHVIYLWSQLYKWKSHHHSLNSLKGKLLKLSCSYVIRTSSRLHILRQIWINS